MTRDEADAQIDAYIDELHEIMGKIETLAAEHDIMVDHPFRNYGESGSATFLTKNNLTEYLSRQGYEEDDFEWLILEAGRLPRWVSSSSFE